MEIVISFVMSIGEKNEILIILIHFEPKIRKWIKMEKAD